MKNYISETKRFLSGFIFFFLLLAAMCPPVINKVAAGNDFSNAGGARVIGKVVNAAGQPVKYARIVMNSEGGQPSFALSNPFGYFIYDDVPTGVTYTFGVKAKGYQPASITRTVNGDIPDLEIVVQE